MLSACSYVYADKFTTCVQNVHLLNACMHRKSLAYTSDVQRDCRGVRRSFKTRLHRVVFCRAGGENKRCLLPRRAADAEVIASHLADIREWVRVSAGQCSSTPCSWDNWALTSREAPDFILYHRNSSGHRTVQILTRGGLQNLGYNVAAHLPDKDSKYWRTGTASAERLEQQWTRRHQRIDWPVACDSKHACVREADILNTCCKFICIDIRTSR